MLPSFLLSLREGLEAALIIGILLGALRKIRREDLASTLWLGVGLASFVSVGVALLLSAIGFEMKDPGEAIFEGITMLLAAGILTWMIFWMSRQARHLKTEIEDGVARAAISGKSALFWVAFIAVAREGIELALFLTAAFFAGLKGDVTAAAVQNIVGALLGLGTAVLLGFTIFASTMRLDLRRFFQVTGALLILFAAGLVAHGIHEFNEVGFIPVVIEHIWNLNAVVSQESFLGELLTTLFGYNASPSLTEMISYAFYLIAALVGTRLVNRLAQNKASIPQRA